MATNVRNLKNPSGDEKPLAIALGGLGIIWGIVLGGLKLAPLFGGDQQDVPVNPVALVVGIAKGRVVLGGQ